MSEKSKNTPTAEQQAITPESGAVYAELPDFDSGDEPIWEAVFNWKSATPGPDASKKAMAVESAIINSLRDFADRTHALRMEQAAPKVAPESFLDGADVQDESGVLAYYSREAVLACITAALESVAAPKAAPWEQNAVSAEWLEQAYREGWAACRDAETIGEEAEDWAFGNSTANSRMIDAQQAAPQQEAQGSYWEGAKEWEKLAWHLCAEENGEDACNELIWEGGPMPEPWGDRWLKYEGEARRMIALVRTHVPAPQHEVQEPWGYARKIPGCGWGFCSKRQYEEAVADGDETKKLYATPQPAPAPLSDDAKDAAFEAVRKKLCALPRFSFFSDGYGAVRRIPDGSGSWIAFDAAHALFDPVAVDAAIAAQGDKA